ncbi:uncharacterized protein FA14DRAFT_187696 [Meira miltonrushii]|uniref:Uncharacterized protein n=1 Tax=Meira miltonrushii TaxID=1280837 RepID=A0A316VJ27_9BASI|nr:uncharacterized protein FA14DRAFT_187696 [Meira miltonrushii]PWN37612.1 hypothetical protein FA14DRAFT_187696 [Meira miltonrushii]
MTVPSIVTDDGEGTRHIITNERNTAVYQFSIETASESLTDLDLHIVPINSTKEHVQTTATASPHTPAKWIRKRILTENDEIVDQVIDVEKRRICWTSHRPTRGWYQYLRSPMLPPNVRIPLQPPKGIVKSVVGSTPLSLTISTRLQLSQLDQLHHRIDCPDMDQKGGESGSTSNADFTTVNLSGNHSTHALNATTQSSAIRSTGVENSSTSQSGHARRRSTGNSISHSGKRSVSNPSSTPVVPEEEASEDLSQSSIMVEEQDPDQFETMDGCQSEVRPCTFVLTDELAAVMQTPAKVQTSSSPGWARWAWSMLPDMVRPALRLDGSKSFSIVWVNAPSTSTRASQAVEVLRFEDQSGLLSWKGQRIGRLLIQKHAVQALNLDLGLWIALALAYLEFLEERDGYHASSDG